MILFLIIHVNEACDMVYICQDCSVYIFENWTPYLHFYNFSSTTSIGKHIVKQITAKILPCWSATIKYDNYVRDIYIYIYIYEVSFNVFRGKL